MPKTRIPFLTILLFLTTLLTACTVRPVDEPQPFPTPLPYLTPTPPEPITGKLVCDDWIDYDFLGPRIFLTDLSTGIVQQLTVEDSSYPKWSPDGKQIAFVSSREGNRDIYVMDADGHSQRRLTNDPGYDSQINWSPDGEKIVFVSDRDGNSEIYTLTLSSGEIKRLTFIDRYKGDPVWSSNGKKIAFVSQVPEHGFMLFVMDSDGKNITQLPYSKYGEIYRPAWCPDDSCLVYEHEVYSKYSKYQRLFVYDFETGKERRLVSSPATGSNTHEWYASFTKDGKYLLFWLLDDENGLYVLDMEADEIYPLRVKGGPCDFYPAPRP